MTVTRQQRSYETSEAPQTSIGHSQKKKALETCQQIFGKELSEDEAREWREILAPIPGWIVTTAFKEYNRTGKFFPRPAQILELVQAHKGKNQIEFHPCSECLNGFIVQEVQSDKYKSGKARVAVRCKCWYEWAGRTE